MGDWYEIGITLGLGVAAGLLLAGLLAAWRYGLLTSALGALAVGALAGLLVKGWIGLPGALLGGLIGAVSASFVARGALRRGATPGGTAFLIGSASIVVALLALVPVSATSWRSWCPPPRRAACGRSPSGMPGCARSRSDPPMSRKLVLVVIDGLTPTMLEASLGTSATPTLTALAEQGTLGAGHDDIPVAHAGLPLVDRHRGASGRPRDPAPRLVAPRRARLVEYGSSFGAARAAGLGRTLRDTLVGMNAAISAAAP